MGLMTAAMMAGGAIAGGAPKTSTTSYEHKIHLDPASDSENFLMGTPAEEDGVKFGRIKPGSLFPEVTTVKGKAAQPGFLQTNFNQLQGFVNSGPGQSDISNSLNASRSLADMFNQYAQSGGLPSQADINSSNSIAQNLFNPQRVAMNQAFADQTTEANRRAALMGRSMNDPILAAKLAQEQTRQGAMLEAQQGSWAQNFALQQPDRRLNYANQHANVLGNLATQAMSNRQALQAMGEGILSRERQFRLSTASKSGTQTTQSGGGFGEAISGGLMGLGKGIKMDQMFGSGGGSSSFNPFSAGGAPTQFSGYNYGQPANSMFGVSGGSSLMGGLR